MNFRLTITVALLFSAIVVSAADSTYNWLTWKKSWPNEKLVMKNILPASANNLISQMEVLDMRSDTSCLGLYTSRSHTPFKIITQMPLQDWMTAKLANNKNGYSVLLVIKDFWINESIVALDRNKKVFTAAPGQIIRYVNASGTKLKCNMDVFIKVDGQYKALVRVDTLLMHLRKVKVGDEILVEECLAIINQKITDAIHQNRYATKRPSTKETIEENYGRVYQLPILADSIIKKGVYYSWEQLKNNRPTEQTFRIQKNKTEPPTLYVQEAQEPEILTRNAFAVCDGKQLYKVHGGFVFNIYRDKRSIYWVGVEELDSREKSIPIFLLLPGAYGYGSESIGSSVRVHLSPYLLNLETGQQY